MQACPRCQQVDAAQKASAIVEAGTSRHESSTIGRFDSPFSFGTWEAQSRSTSRTDLATSLKRPSAPPFAALITAMVPITAVVGGLALVFYLLGDDAWVVLLVVGIVALWGVLLLLLLSRLPEYERAMERWDKLWFCHRCDIAYVPGTSVQVDRSDVQAFLCQSDSGVPAQPEDRRALSLLERAGFLIPKDK